MVDLPGGTHFRSLDCQISAVDMHSACNQVNVRVQDGSGGYVCFVNTHTCVTARSDARLLQAINNAAFAMPDGKPIATIGRLRGRREVERVGGPDFMFEFFRAGYRRRHFLMGSTDETLHELVANLRRQFPHEEIVGVFSPPFGPFDEAVNADIQSRIQQAQPDIVWVGLGAPKQEYWMADRWQSLRPALLMGVGAAFDFHAGMISRAPVWMQKSGLEWLHRLCQEPRRLWKRYLVTNTRFLAYVTADLVRGNSANDGK